MFGIKLHELYALRLHNEDIDVLGATDIQQKLIEVFESYSDHRTLARDICNLERVRRRHAEGIEFCGDILKHSDSREIRDSKLIELINQGYSCAHAANQVKLNYCSAWKLLHEHGYRYNGISGKWEI